MSAIEYSEKYYDDDCEYRCGVPALGSRPPRTQSLARRRNVRPPPRSHVILPKHVSKNAPKGRLLSESEWRGLGVQQSRGWVHYAIHRPEPHILLFRRPQGTDPTTGLVHGKRIDPQTGKVCA